MKSVKKPATKQRVNTYEVYPKAGVAQTIMYQNMSSHYRRIYNAKARIDTGPPFSHKPKHISWNKKTIDSYKLNLPKTSQSYISLNSTNKCSRQSCSDQTSLTFKPQITKSEAESKLRSLRVYYPPRRRMVYSSSSTSIEIKRDSEMSVPEIPWIHTSEEVKQSPSKGSSSDSAYTEEGEGVWSGGESRGHTPVSDTQREVESEDLLYAKFVRDITEEVLRKGVFTNRALKTIFHNHIESHKKFLNLRRMQEEVEKLQLELGIPKEDLDVDCGKPYSASTIPTSCTTFDVDCGKSYSVSTIPTSCTTFDDTELMEALSQLNLSASLKADIASTLGLRKHYVSTDSNIQTSSGSLEVIHAARQKTVPQSDDDSYEIVSEGSESRPHTPLGLAW